MSAENVELIACLKQLRHSGYKFCIDWDGEDYEIAVFNEEFVTVFNARGQMREIINDALAQIEQAK